MFYIYGCITSISIDLSSRDARYVRTMSCPQNLSKPFSDLSIMFTSKNRFLTERLNHRVVWKILHLKSSHFFILSNGFFSEYIIPRLMESVVLMFFDKTSPRILIDVLLREFITLLFPKSTLRSCSNDDSTMFLPGRHCADDELLMDLCWAFFWELFSSFFSLPSLISITVALSMVCVHLSP